MTQESAQTQDQPVRAGPSTDPAVRYFIAAAMLIGFGLWCIFDKGNYPYSSPSEDINGFLYWAFNHGGAIAFPVVGLIPLVKAVRQMRRRIVAGSEDLQVGPRRIPYDQVAQLDASRFRSKGLLVLRLKGQDDLLLDAWHYRREEFREVVRRLEQKVPVNVGESPQQIP